MISLRGKRALVTGGSRGIGAATAILLAECGADVGIGYKARTDDAAQVAKQGADALLERASREFGGIDLFVANAGIWPTADIAVAEMDDERWVRTMRENVDAMFFTARAAARVMSDGGRIVLVSSTAGQRGEAFHADYAASKGAMISFTKSLCIELAPRGITVNSVAPGWVDTDMAAHSFSNGGRERIAATIPVGRVASPRDIAGPIVFLCSDLARHVTGEILNVNGGAVLCG
jgi:3-oxoacyl-[acyl-carrier protein] reductase